jgi:hypothetical protein
VGAGGRNDSSLVCTYELKKSFYLKKKKESLVIFLKIVITGVVEQHCETSKHLTAATFSDQNCSFATTNIN